MPRVVFIEPGGARREIDAPVGITLMEAARQNGVQGIVAQCGGACACATCHVYVAAEWQKRLAACEDMEEGMLETAWEPRSQQPSQLPDPDHRGFGRVDGDGPRAPGLTRL